MSDSPLPPPPETQPPLSVPTGSPPAGPMPATPGMAATAVIERVDGPDGVASPPVPAIVAHGLTKRYGPLRAVDHIDFFVPRGSVYGLIGPNGAGKSTLMSMCASLLLPTAGSILVEGHSPVAEPFEVRKRIGYMPDGLGVYEGMTVSEYIDFFAAAYKVPRDEWASLADSLLELVELEVKRTAEVNTLSRGMKQRLSLARALVHDPSVLILDEPASGLDPRARIELRHMVENLNAMGKTILVSSHILTELQEISSHVGIMEAGKLLASGSPEQILAQSQSMVRVRAGFADGTTEEFDIPEGMTKAEKLRQLVLDDPREVVEFTDVTSGLEDVFLSVTQGIVQ